MSKCKKTCKQVFLFVLSLIMIFSSCSIANAADNNHDDEVAPLYSVISCNTVYFGISGIKASCSTTLTADYYTSLKTVIELQKKKSSGYTTIATWSESKNSVSMAYTVSRNINILCDYRVKVTFTADNEKTVVYKYA